MQYFDYLSEATDMDGIERVNGMLDEAKVFYLATENGDAPRIRPLGFHMIADGRILFGVGDFKEVYKQMQANPKVEVAAMAGKYWLRYWGTAEFLDDRELEAKALEVIPSLKAIYNDETGYRMRLFYLKDAKAQVVEVMNVVEEYEL